MIIGKNKNGEQEDLILEKNEDGKSENIVLNKNNAINNKNLSSLYNNGVCVSNLDLIGNTLGNRKVKFKIKYNNNLKFDLTYKKIHCQCSSIKTKNLEFKNFYFERKAH